MKLSIIIPVLDEAAGIEAALAALAPFRARGVEVIVADGGSSDGTTERARAFADQVIAAPAFIWTLRRPATCCCFCTPTRGCPRMPIAWWSTASRIRAAAGAVSTYALMAGRCWNLSRP